MIKTLKIGFLIASLSLFLGAGYVSAADVIFTAETFIELGGETYSVSAGSLATTVIVGITSVTVTVAQGDALIFSSFDKYRLNNDQSIKAHCTPARTYLTINGPTTVVITPDTSKLGCAGGGGGGGGGGSGGVAPATPATPAVPADSTPPADCLPGYNFSPTTGRSCVSATPPADCLPGYSFSPSTGRNCHAATPATPSTGATLSNFGGINALVKQGTRGEACRAWQSFFNARRNAGLATDGVCGPKTMAAARAWQAASGLVADGLLGPMSRARAETE